MDERDVRTMLRELGDGVEGSRDLTSRARSTYKRRETRKRVAASAFATAAIAVVGVIGFSVVNRGDHQRIKTVGHPKTEEPVVGRDVSPDELVSLSFVDGLHGFAVTAYDGSVNGNRLAATTDGGRSWHLQGAPITGLASSDIKDVEVAFTSRQDGYVAGNNRAITHDGGRTWQVDREPTYGQLVPVGNSIWATRQDPLGHVTIEESTDGGRTWRPIKSPSSGFMPSLVRPTRSTAFGVVDQSTVAATLDGGNSWQLSTVQCGDQRANILGILSGDTQHPWVVCGNASQEEPNPPVPVSILRSLGGGRNFAPVADAPYGSRLIVGDAIHAWIVGNGLRVTNDGGKTWSHVEGVPDGTLVDSARLDTHRVWMLLRSNANPSEARVWRTTDGKHWQQLGGQDARSSETVPSSGQAVTVDQFEKLAFLDAQHGFATQKIDRAPPQNVSARLAETIDGGKTWHLVGVPLAAKTLTAVDAKHAFAYDPLLYRTDDGGATWQQVKNPSGPFVDSETSGEVADSGVRIFSERNGTAWAYVSCGGEGSCFLDVSQNGGVNWQRAPSVPEFPSGGAGAVSMAALGTGSVAIVYDTGSKAYLATTLDLASSWKVTELPCQPGAGRSLQVTNDDGWWLVCTGPGAAAGSSPTEVYRSKDRGLTWSIVASDPMTHQQPVGDLQACQALTTFVAVDNRHATAGCYGMTATSDGGKTWREVVHYADAPNGGPSALVFTDSTHGWALREAALWRTTDGKTWKKIAG